MKTVGELIHSLDLEDVLAALKRLYTGEGEDEDGYREVWSKLTTMQPQNTTTTVLLSRAKRDPDYPSEEPWIDVSGLEPGDTQHWAIEFVAWAQWLSMPIKVAGELSPMPETEQLAHCLYEMTFAGYDQADIEDKLEEIRDIHEQVKAMTEDEIKALPKFQREMKN